MRTLLIGILLLMAAFAGCLSGDDPETEGDGENGGDGASGSSGGSGSGATSEGGSGNTNESSEENIPPEAKLTVSAEVGEAPLNVTFDLFGSDDDGGPLTWTLDLGDGNETEGDTLPTTYTHTYALAGNHSVNFTVSDGDEETTAEATVEVTPTATQEPIQEETLSWDHENPYWMGDPASVLSLLGDDVAFPDPVEGVTYDTFAVDPDTHGRTFLIVYACDSEDSQGIAFFDDDGEQLLRDWASNSGNDCEIENTVPAGAANAYVYSGGGGDSANYTA